MAASFANPGRRRRVHGGRGQALAGQDGALTETDYRGQPVPAAHAPIRIGQTVWALVVKLDEAEALAGVRALQRASLIAGALAALAALGLALAALRRWLLRPVQALRDYAGQVAAGDLDASASSRFSGELGDLLGPGPDGGRLKQAIAQARGARPRSKARAGSPGRP